MSLDHSAPSLSDLLKKLQIPTDYARIEHWKLGVHSVLDQILQFVKSDEELSLEDQGHIVFASSPFTTGFPVQPDQLSAEHEKNTLDKWVTPDARQSAQGIVFVLLYKINLLSHPIFRTTCFANVFIAVPSTSGTGSRLQPEAHL